MTNLSGDTNATQDKLNLSSPKLISDLFALTVRILVLSRTYTDTPSELSLRIEGLTTDGVSFHRVWVIWFLQRAQVHMGGVLYDSQVGTLLELKSTPGGASLEPGSLPESVQLYLYGPEYEVLKPGAFAPVLLDQLFDYLNERIEEHEIFDESVINDECLCSPVTHEELLHSIAASWRGSRWFREQRSQDVKERQMSNPGYLDFTAKVCLSGRDEAVFGHLQGMCKRVEIELRRAVETHPEWFNLCSAGPSAYEVMQAGMPGEPLKIHGPPIEILPRVCTTIDDLPIHFGPAEVYAFVTDSETPGGWVVPPASTSRQFARFSIIFTFSFQNTSPFLVRFAPESPPTYIATAIEDLVKAYVFPEAIAMNDFTEMQCDLCWGTCLYSQFEFDLRWGGFASVSERVKAAMEGNGNTFAVLSYPMDGFDAEMPLTLSAICEMAENSLRQDAKFLLSCSLNVVAGRGARLSLYCRLPEGERTR